MDPAGQGEPLYSRYSGKKMENNLDIPDLDFKVVSACVRRLTSLQTTVHVWTEAFNTHV